MSITVFAACAVVVCILVVTVKQLRPEMGTVMLAAAGVVMLAAAVEYLLPAMESIARTVSSTGAGEYSAVVFKALGVCLVTKIAADICRDSGQNTIASHVETAGRAALLVLSLPLLASVLDVSSEIIGG